MPISDVSWALSAVYGAATPHAERAAATELLEAFKARAEGQLPALLELASPERPDAERHFALHALLELVQRRWPSVDDATRSQLKGLALELIHDAGQRAEPPFVSSSLARLVLELALREWPQRWTELTPRLLAIGGSSPRHAALALECIGSFAEAVHTAAGAELPDQRRSELSKALEAAAEELSAFAEQAAGHALAHVQRLEPGAPADGGTCAAVELARAAARCLRCLVEWLPCAPLVRLGVEQAGAALLRVRSEHARLTPRGATGEDVRASGCELLHALAVRKFPEKSPADQRDLLLVATADAVLSALRSAELGESLARPAEEAEYALHKQLAAMLASLGAALLARVHVHVPIAAGTSAAGAVAGAEGGGGGAVVQALDALSARLCAVSDALLEFSRHPSALLCAPAHPFWHALLRSEQLAADEPRFGMRARCCRLLQLALLKLQPQARGVGGADEEELGGCGVDADEDPQLAAGFANGGGAAGAGGGCADDAGGLPSPAEVYGELDCLDEDELADALGKQRAVVVAWLGMAVGTHPGACIGCAAAWTADAARRAASAEHGSAPSAEAAAVLEGACALLEAILRDARRLGSLAQVVGGSAGGACAAGGAVACDEDGGACGGVGALEDGAEAAAALDIAIGVLVGWSAPARAHQSLLARALAALVPACACGGAAARRLPEIVPRLAALSAPPAPLEARGRAAMAMSALAREALPVLQSTPASSAGGEGGGAAAAGGCIDELLLSHTLASLHAAEGGGGSGEGALAAATHAYCRHLLEALALLANGAPTIDAQRRLLESILSAPLATLGAAGAELSARGGAGLAALLGLADGAAGVRAREGARTQLLRALGTCHVVLRRAGPPSRAPPAATRYEAVQAHPFAPHAATVLESACALISAIDELTIDGGAGGGARVEPSLLAAGALKPSARAHAMHLGAPLPAASSGGDADASVGAAEAVSGWLISARREACNLVSTGAANGAVLFVHGAACEALARAARPERVRCLAPMQLSQLIGVVRAVVCAWPAEVDGSVVSALLPPFVTALTDRLAHEWAALGVGVVAASATPLRSPNGSGGGGGGGGVPNDAQAEVLHARLIRQLSLDALECVHAALVATPAELGAGPPRAPAAHPAGVPVTQTLGPVGQRLLSSERTARPVLSLLASAFGWRDASAVRHAAAAVAIALPVLATEPTLRAALGAELLPQALRCAAWVDAPHGEVVACLRDVHRALLDTLECPTSTLLGLPGVTPGLLDETESVLRSSAEGKFKQKVYRDFLGGTIALAIGSGTPTAEAQLRGRNGGGAVQDLPEALVVYGGTTGKRAAEAAAAAAARVAAGALGD